MIHWTSLTCIHMWFNQPVPTMFWAYACHGCRRSGRSATPDKFARNGRGSTYFTLPQDPSVLSSTMLPSSGAVCSCAYCLRSSLLDLANCATISTLSIGCSTGTLFGMRLLGHSLSWCPWRLSVVFGKCYLRTLRLYLISWNWQGSSWKR